MTQPRRIGYLLSKFPETHETFILREIQAVSTVSELTIDLFSLKRCRDKVVHEAARPFAAVTVYPSPVSILRGLGILLFSARARAILGDVLSAYRTPFISRCKAFVTLVLACSFLREIRRRGIDHIHAHWATMPALAGYFLKRFCGIPYSITAHAWDIYAEKTMLREKILESEFVVTCTGANRQALMDLGAPGEKVHLSYHGLNFQDLPPPRFVGRGEMNLLAVGRLVEQKGFSDLIEACALLKERGHTLRVKIIGEGPLRGELELLAEARRISGELDLPGTLPQPEVFRAYGEATCFVAPSVIARDGDRDGIPNVILEAMSQGVPVVSTAVSGIPEVVRPGETGWLIPPGDPEALASAIEEVHRVGAGTCTRNAHELVQRDFDAQKNAAAIIGLLKPPSPGGSDPEAELKGDALIPSSDSGSWNIAFVIDELEVGGTQRQILEMALGLRGRGWMVVVVCLQPVLGMAEEFEKAGIPVHLIRKRRTLDLGLVLALRRFFRREKIGIVHAFSSTAEFFAGIAARASGCRFIASIRNFNESLRPLPSLGKRLACGLANLVVANSHASGRQAVQRGLVKDRKLQVIPNGIRSSWLQLPDREEARARLESTGDACLILSVGRLVKIKGYEDTLEIARRVAADHPEARFLIAGDGPLRADMERWIRERGVGSHVRLLGERNDIPALVAASDIYLNTSIAEGLSNSIMEAMAGSLPVVATAVGGTPELIRDGENGFLIPPGDPTAAVRSLGRLIGDAVLRHRMGEEGRRLIIAEYDTQSMVSRLERNYHSLLDSGVA